MVFIKSKPFDLVLKLFPMYARIQDLLNLLFFIIINLNRFRWFLHSYTCLGKGSLAAFYSRSYL